MVSPGRHLRPVRRTAATCRRHLPATPPTRLTTCCAGSRPKDSALTPASIQLLVLADSGGATLRAFAASKHDPATPRRPRIASRSAAVTTPRRQVLESSIRPVQLYQNWAGRARRDYATNLNYIRSGTAGSALGLSAVAQLVVNGIPHRRQDSLTPSSTSQSPCKLTSAIDCGTLFLWPPQSWSHPQAVDAKRAITLGSRLT